MNEKKIQTMLNVEILNRMNDKSAASVLKNILFSPDTHIDWNEAYQLMMAFMPELNTIEGYKKENVTTYTDFITDLDKMRDFFDMSKEDFLLFYSYLEEIEYDLTAAKLKNMTTEENNKKKKKNPSYGRVVCRCEEITEGEILDAIHRNPPARDIDGVKRRTRAGMGRCQGGFCMPSVAELLSEELKIPFEKVTKSGKGSEITFERTKTGGEK